MVVVYLPTTHPTVAQLGAHSSPVIRALAGLNRAPEHVLDPSSSPSRVWLPLATTARYLERVPPSSPVSGGSDAHYTRAGGLPARRARGQRRTCRAGDRRGGQHRNRPGGFPRAVAEWLHDRGPHGGYLDPAGRRADGEAGEGGDQGRGRAVRVSRGAGTRSAHLQQRGVLRGRPSGARTSQAVPAQLRDLR